jgi:hypothetical protein
MKRPVRTLTRCLVCGFTEVRTDEVVDRGLLFLAECPRCAFRWTSEEPIGTPRGSALLRIPGDRGLERGERAFA